MKTTGLLFTVLVVALLAEVGYLILSPSKIYNLHNPTQTQEFINKYS